MSPLEYHEKLGGKIEVNSKVKNIDKNILSIVYTPGVAQVSKSIYHNKENVWKYTWKRNSVAIVTDGTRVLGLGDIGPEAALPVMEGKALLFKHYGNVDAVPICVNTTDKEKIIEVVKLISPGFGGINLEDIKSPKCFEVYEELSKTLNIPVFHDDRHGTAVVILAGLYNALKVVEKDIFDAKIVVAGAGAAGYGIFELLKEIGVKRMYFLDSKGIIYRGREENMNKYKKEIAEHSNPENLSGTIDNIIEDADVFIGLSGVPGLLKNEHIKKMNDPIVFALTNPEPEIRPEDATNARIIATGRSDYPNQINNMIVFPFLFRALLDFRIKRITNKLLIETAKAVAEVIENPSENEIIPSIQHSEKILEHIKTRLKQFKGG